MSGKRNAALSDARRAMMAIARECMALGVPMMSKAAIAERVGVSATVVGSSLAMLRSLELIKGTPARINVKVTRTMGYGGKLLDYTQKLASILITHVATPEEFDCEMSRDNAREARPKAEIAVERLHVRRAIRIIARLALARNAMLPTVVEIARQVGLPVTTVNRYLNQMREDGTLRMRPIHGYRWQVLAVTTPEETIA